jgi:NAD(P)-dependent dehydrogenase (short-subunit alcohol dehydrogenase family)
MPSDKPEQNTIRRLSQITTIVRGLLAKPSGNIDDPYARALVKCLPGVASLHHASADHQPALLVKQLDAGLATDELRESLRKTLTQYSAQHGTPAQAVILEGMGTLHIEYPVEAHYDALRNKVALVTGAAGAIGAGICKGLLEKGCRVAATDLVQERLDTLVAEMSPSAGDRIIGIRMDTTEQHDVAHGFASLVRAWGGVDIVIINAGIALVASLMDMDLQAFRKLETVNIEGTLLTLAEAGRWMSLQGTGGDIVLISTKNVVAPGAQFGAYSATKAAGHQLARIASLEFAPMGIRVNMVSPDAVFSDGQRKSGLWAEVGPSRMKARGLDEKGLEEYYRNRNLLKARITPAHVANAVLFFVTRQTPTSGATIPVDGGLPDATPR